MRLTWLQRYRLTSYLQTSIWVRPTVVILAALGTVRLLDPLERFDSSLNPSTAQALLATMAASMFTFIVFVSSALLVAVQLADFQGVGGQRGKDGRLAQAR